MISAKEARCRVENAKAIKELEKRLDFAIATAIENGNYKVSAVAPKGIDRRRLRCSYKGTYRTWLYSSS